MQQQGGTPETELNFVVKKVNAAMIGRFDFEYVCQFHKFLDLVFYCYPSAGDEYLPMDTCVLVFRIGERGIFHVAARAGGSLAAPFFPKDVGGDEAAGGDLVITVLVLFGDEAHAHVGDLLGGDFLFGGYTVSGGVGGVVECAYAIEFHRAAVCHEVGKDTAEGFEHGEGVGRADGGFDGKALGHFVGSDGLAYGY